MDPKLEAILNRIKSGEIETACVCGLLDDYYQKVIWRIDEKCDDDLDPEDEPFPEEFLQPVEDRCSGIGIALSELLDAGHDVNGEDGVFNALMAAVVAGDAPKVRYLIRHGADASSWPEMDQEPAADRRNYYLEDIDIAYMNESFANDADIDYLKALHRTALVLAEEAHLGPYAGYCLKIDDMGNVSLVPAEMKF